MRRRNFLKAAFTTGALFGAGGLPAFNKVACAAGGMPVLGNRILVNIMLSGAPDFRHLFTPPFDPIPGAYGYEYWAARAGSHSIPQSVSAYESRWANDYWHVNDGSTVFGILARCGWLKRMWDAGNVAIIANAVGGTTRNHAHCKLIMEQGNLSSGPNDSDRSGWGGRLASYAGGNVLSLSRSPRPFTFGLHAGGPDSHDNRNLISARNTRELSLFRPGSEISPLSKIRSITRGLSGYYSALKQGADIDPLFYRFVEHEQLLRKFGEPIEERLSTVEVPGSISNLMDGGLYDGYLGEQIRNLYDSFVCSDILLQRVASLEVGGWDTHRLQRDVLEPKLEDLFGDGKALDSLYQGLPTDVLDNMVLVLGGEFGRQLRANGDGGTDHGRGTSILVIGNRVQGGVYGNMFPEEEIGRLNENSPDINGLTTIDSVYSRICEWIQPASGDLVFPDQSLSMIEDGVNLDTLFA